MSYTLIWLIVAVVCIGSELLLTQFILLFFGVGALVACGVSYFTNSLPVMLTVFSVVSLACLFLFRSRLVAYVGKSGKKNVAEKMYDGTVCPYIGQKALVTRTINENGTRNSGEVEVGGSFWMAASASDAVIEKGSYVIVEGWQEDNHLILNVK